MGAASRSSVCAFLLAAVALAGCSDETQDHPMAFFTVSPRFLCAGDGHRTQVSFDAAQSQAEPQLLLTGEAQRDDTPVSLRWDLGSPGVRIVEGDLASEKIVATYPGDSIVEVELVVRRADGDTARAVERLGLTIARASPCGEIGLPCNENEACARLLGGGQGCLPTTECQTDIDCPSCYHCDGRRCEP